MHISTFNHKLKLFEKFLDHHQSPSPATNQRFLTQEGKTYSNTTILKHLEELSVSLNKKHGKLDDSNRKKIYSVLYNIRGVTRAKIYDKYHFRSKHSDSFLHTRLDQVASLLERLGILFDPPARSQEPKENYKSTTSRTDGGVHKV